MAREYKDSGIYNEAIPLTWNVRKFGGLCSVVTDFVASGSFADLRANVHYLDSPDYAMLVRTTDLAKSNRSEKRVYISKESYDYLSNSNLFGGEIVLPNIGSIGDVYIVPSDLYSRMSLAPNAIMFKTNECDKYFYYYFQSKVGGVQLDEISQSTAMAKFNKTDLRQLRVLCPPYSEQQKIADYLDKVCGEVDELVAIQETMIEELKAYKQSVITEAVTKGLNPNAPMRNSGIDWIGEIPKHWEVIKLSFLTSKIGSGSTPTGGANVYVHEGVKFLRSQNVYFEGLNLNDVAFITETIDEEMKGTRVKPGDVLLNITGGSIGRCYYVDESLGRANVNQHVSIIRPTKIETIYLKYSLQSDLGQNQIALLQTGGNREGLSAAALSNFKILFPPMSEQRTIASYLDTKCSEIDSLIALKQAKIEELKEYKKSVIYEYVTGKKEVC